MELQRNYSSFQDAGVEVVALAVNSAGSVNGVQQVVKAAYPLLADPDHQAAEAYGVYNLLGDGLAAPSVFVIDADGNIVWSYIGQNSHDRPSTQAILEQLP